MIGEAFDVTAPSTLTDQQRTGRATTRSTVEYAVRNAQPRPVSVSVRQEGLLRSRVISENFPSTRFDAGALLWTLPVPANGETKLTVTVETRE